MEKRLPKNWVNVSLKDVTKNVKGKKPKIQSEVEFEGSVPYMDIKALEYNEIRQYADVESSKLFEEGDVGMVWDGARSGWVSKTNLGAIGSTLVAFKPILLESNYLFYYLFEKYPFINSNARGVGIPHVDPTVLWSLDFPLPPLAEQNRIVAILDSLFAQLEMIKTSMASIPVLLKNFRQQVLTQAVTGKLTESWRVGKDLEGWKKCVLLDVINEKPRNGYSPKAVDYETPVKSLSLSATTSGKFNPLHVKYLDVPIPNEKSHLWLKKNDILIQRSNSLDYVGTAAVYDGSDFDFIYPDIMMKIRANDQILNEYLFYSLSSSMVKKYFKNNASGTAGNMPKINQETVSNTPINLPILLEQQEIVSRVESLFAKADAIEKQYKTLKEKIDALPQAMLHKAFKGELVEQLDTDGDARELLKEIEELKSVSTKMSKLKEFNKKSKRSYKETNEVLGMVAEDKN
ncbi:MAG: type I restriction endonuclease subunit S [Paludibacter sp.]|nr:type I restriction endonuclease subunit S [Paludibacter sp.]